MPPLLLVELSWFDPLSATPVDPLVLAFDASVEPALLVAAPFVLLAAPLDAWLVSTLLLPLFEPFWFDAVSAAFVNPFVLPFDKSPDCEAPFCAVPSELLPDWLVSAPFAPLEKLFEPEDTSEL